MQCIMKKTPQSIGLMMELGFFSVDMWTFRVTGTGLQINPMIIQQVAVHDVKFGVWCAVSAAGITKTFFFLMKPQPHTEMLNTCWHQCLNSCLIKRKHIIFKKNLDNASAHLAKILCFV